MHRANAIFMVILDPVSLESLTQRDRVMHNCEGIRWSPVTIMTRYCLSLRAQRLTWHDRIMACSPQHA